ncbi:hypothetical protein R69927_04365 [Paraburkholderia domus]|jgi:hypothetical protein|uniref:Uncharacterized protein n=1 Tax=Paraburkholderia domus TaxID=2793075 RepID=A0A9N8R565_9BURK|nr:hypothetical protein [Paraburkholderia domus]MBK5051945.1 hypothetical protein [Burkholderia sp. R-70006]MBK5063825.1 hypothetical protein [Burkholderia sp. R-70199]MBK5088817.1 hypothetical protein [Burkholderia sp. R-69927]MBK5122312.1 hypothetical protein [Burkholderia sp. R-69980]MBK5167800.1 hypothetical protein [Burkholderia sp. R-70211]MBK5182904.1 hypothetical protein [Burkholderia sp. R-69749]MCI0149069.1 hypothetical protein [Paraburkholderia sediminicola]
MPITQLHAGLPRDAVTSRLAAGQMAVHDLRAQTSIVAVEGALQLDFRDHSLAWLGDTVPVTSITLHEGERFVTPQRGLVSISAAHTHPAVFVVQPRQAENARHSFIRQAAHHLANLAKTRLRRAV